MREADRLRAELQRITGRRYRIKYELLDRESACELLRALRDIDYETNARVNRARREPWRR